MSKSEKFRDIPVPIGTPEAKLKETAIKLYEEINLKLKETNFSFHKEIDDYFIAIKREWIDSYKKPTLHNKTYNLILQNIH